MDTFGHYGFYQPASKKPEDFVLKDFFVTNIGSLGGMLIEGTPPPAIVFGNTDSLKAYDWECLPYKCMFGEERLRILERKKIIQIGDAVLIDPRITGKYVKNWRGETNFLIMSGWYHLTKILRRYYSTLKLRPEELLPIKFLEEVCGDTTKTQEDLLYEHYLLNTKAKNKEVSFRRDIDETIMALTIQTAFRPDVEPEKAGYSCQNILALLRSTKQEWLKNDEQKAA